MIIVIIYLHLNYVSIYEKMTAKIGRKKREPKNHIIKQSLLCLKKKQSLDMMERRDHFYT
jgi:hypothetical protein